MKMQDDMDFTTLSWVKRELDDTLKQARQALTAYVEDTSDASQMRFCATYLHQVHGTLRMVELVGPAMVVEEMEHLAQAVMETDLGDSETAFEVLIRGMVQLPDYLERLQSGHRDIPIVLLPLLNDLRQVSGRSPLTEISMFTPRLEAELPVSGPAAPIPDVKLRTATVKLRKAFEAAFLVWMKRDDPQLVARLKVICERLAQASSIEPARRLYWIAASVLAGVEAGVVKLDKRGKLVFGKVDMQIKRQALKGEAVLADDAVDALARQLLYYAATADSGCAPLDRLKGIFALDELMPDDAELEHARGSMQGHNRELVTTVSGAIKEDIMRVKEGLDLKVRKGDVAQGGYEDLVEILDRVADTLGMIGLSKPREDVIKERERLASFKDGGVNEASLMDVASTLLYVEGSLDDYIDRIGSGRESPADEDRVIDGDLPEAEVRRLLDALMKESSENLKEIKRSIIEFIEAPWDFDRMSAAPQLLEEIIGGLAMLELNDASELLGGVVQFVHVELLHKREIPSAEKLDTLADAVASIEYYLEAVREHRPNRDNILKVARASLDSLGYLGDAGLAKLEAVRGTEPAPAEPQKAPKVKPSPPPSAVPETGAADGSGDQTPQAGEPAGPPKADISEEIDEEIREIFIEEVEEELATLNDLYPKWRADLEDQDSLTTIRRTFHTLKGSGRLVGAMTIGEFSWQIENLLNRILDGTREPTPAVMRVMDAAVDAIPQLLANVKGEGAPTIDIAAIRHTAEQLASGEEAELPSAVAPDAADESTDVVDQDAADMADAWIAGEEEADAQPADESAEAEPQAAAPVDAESAGDDELKLTAAEMGLDEETDAEASDVTDTVDEALEATSEDSSEDLELELSDDGGAAEPGQATDAQRDGPETPEFSLEVAEGDEDDAGVGAAEQTVAEDAHDDLDGLEFDLADETQGDAPVDRGDSESEAGEVGLEFELVDAADSDDAGMELDVADEDVEEEAFDLELENEGSSDEGFELELTDDGSGDEGFEIELTDEDSSDEGFELELTDEDSSDEGFELELTDEDSGDEGFEIELTDEDSSDEGFELELTDEDSSDEGFELELTDEDSGDEGFELELADDDSGDEGFELELSDDDSGDEGFELELADDDSGDEGFELELTDDDSGDEGFELELAEDDSGDDGFELELVEEDSGDEGFDLDLADDESGDDEFELILEADSSAEPDLGHETADELATEGRDSDELSDLADELELSTVEDRGETTPQSLDIGLDELVASVESSAVHEDEEVTREIDRPDAVADDEEGESAIDPVLLDILRSEVDGHLATVKQYLERCRGEQQSLEADEPLLRAVHTLNGAIAMVDVVPLVTVTGPLERYIKRLRFLHRAPDADGLATIGESVEMVEAVVAELHKTHPQFPDSQPLSEHLSRLAEGLPEPSDPSMLFPVVDDTLEQPSPDSPEVAMPIEDSATEAADAADEYAGADSETAGSDAEGESESESELASETLDDTWSPEEEAADAAVVSSEVTAAEEDLSYDDASIDSSVGKGSDEDADELAFDDDAFDRFEADLTGDDDDQTDREDSEEPAGAEAFEVDDSGLSWGDETVDDDGEDISEDISLEAFAEDAEHEEEVAATDDALEAFGDDDDEDAEEPEPEPEQPQESLLPVGGDPGHIAFEELGEVDDELLEIFVEEGTEILDQCDRSMVAWRESPEELNVIVELQRELHTLKGGARMAGINPIGDLSHAMESVFEAIVDERVTSRVALVELMEMSFDRLHRMLGQVSNRRNVTLAADLLPAMEAALSGREIAAPVAPAPAPAVVPGVPAERADETPVSAIATETAMDQGAQSGRPQEIIRVRADMLDNLVNFAGEVSIYRARLEQQVGTFRFNLIEFDQTVTRLRDQLRKLEIETEAQILSRFQREADEFDEDFDPLEMDRYSQLQQYSRALAESVADLVSIQGMLDDLTRESETLLLQQSRVNSELQEGLMRTRMVPFDSLVPRLRRIVRQTSQELGKRAQLRVEGAHGEMDRTVLERVTAPLEHMLRNAVAHGLEDPDSRRSAGKGPEGTIRIQVSREATEVVIRVSDDGAGIDASKIREKAIERGLMTADAELTERDLFGFILETGFSTAESVSKISGRGVGMDVVNSEIKQLGGTLDINSERGQGTLFTVRLPFTLAVTHAIMVKVGEVTFAIPLSSIEGVVRMQREDFDKRMAADETTYEYAGEPYQLQELSELLGMERGAQEGMLPILMSKVGDQRAAIRIDAVMSSREIVVKSVGPQVSSIPGIFGATILGDGSVIMILDLGPLIRRGATQLLLDGGVVEAPEPVEEARAPLIMVVDDSITMRKVTTRVLERHDMEVMTAKDGVDAVEQLQERIPDLMLLDIEMPRMDGFEVAGHMKSDSRLDSIPIIMITSRTGDKHRQRALEIGVNRYLGKPYQEADLLENVRDLLGITAEAN